MSDQIIRGYSAEEASRAVHHRPQAHARDLQESAERWAARGDPLDVARQRAAGGPMQAPQEYYGLNRDRPGRFAPQDAVEVNRPSRGLLDCLAGDLQMLLSRADEVATRTMGIRARVLGDRTTPGKDASARETDGPEGVHRLAALVREIERSLAIASEHLDAVELL